MKRIAIVASALVLALSGVGFADLARVGTPNGVAVVASSGTASSSGINELNLGAIDGVTGLTLSGGVGGGTATVDFQLNAPVTGPRGETTFLLFATTASGASLTALSIGTGSGGGFSLISTAVPAPSLVLVGGGATNRFVGSFTGAIPTYTTFRAVFTLGVGGTLGVDMVSNPEPGTLALFGLGMAGMFALAWRRRNAAKLAGVKSLS